MSAMLSYIRASSSRTSGRVRVVRRNLDVRRVRHERLPLARRARREDLALVGDLEIEDREERLRPSRTVPPVRGLAEIVPDRERHAELIVGLGAVAGEVAGGAQVLRERLDVERRHREVGPGQLRHAIFRRPHVLRANRRLIHAGDDRGAARRADRRGRERVRVADDWLAKRSSVGVRASCRHRRRDAGSCPRWRSRRCSAGSRARGRTRSWRGGLSLSRRMTSECRKDRETSGDDVFHSDLHATPPAAATTSGDTAEDVDVVFHFSATTSDSVLGGKETSRRRSHRMEWNPLNITGSKHTSVRRVQACKNRNTRLNSALVEKPLSWSNRRQSRD